MVVIITMAGSGKRFRDAGFECPKYMIEACGKTIFEWSMDSLLDYNLYVERYIFVVQKLDDATSFIQEKCRKYDIKNLDVLELDHQTDGQAATCAIAIDYYGISDSVMIYNIDTYIEPFELKFVDIGGDGYIPCFYGEGNHWSFVKANAEGRALEVREKKRISDNCTIGAYFFSSAALYKSLYEEYYADVFNVEKGEKYIAPLYNCMIKKGMDVRISIVDAKKVHVLGTPEELKRFLILRKESAV